MSAKRDWMARKNAERVSAERRLDAQDDQAHRHRPLPAELAPIVEQCLAAKQAGRFFKMPATITPAQAKRVWAATFQRLKAQGGA